MKNKIIFKTLMLKGEAGSTIVSMEKTGHVGTADIYTITFNDGSTTEISLENMSAITSVEKTSSTDTEDIYTITCADGSTQTFSVLNHNADIAAMSDDIDTIDARVDNFINSVVPNTVETLWTGSIKEVGDSATLSKAVSNFDYIDLYLLGSADSKYIRVPSSQTSVEIQQQNLSDDASSNFLRLWEMGVSISGTTVSITKSIAWAWDDPNNSNPTVTANAQNSVPITRIDGVKVASDTPAEVTDIRVASNGAIYSSAGNAVRSQIGELSKYGVENVCPILTGTYYPGTFTFTGDTEGNYTVSGTNSSGSNIHASIYNQSNAFPNGIKAGDKICVKLDSTNTNIRLYVMAYNNGDWDESLYLTSGYVYYQIPNTATGFRLRFTFPNGTVCDSEKLTPYVFVDKTKHEYDEEIETNTTEIELLKSFMPYDYIHIDATLTDGLVNKWNQVAGTTGYAYIKQAVSKDEKYKVSGWYYGGNYPAYLLLNGDSVASFHNESTTGAFNNLEVTIPANVTHIVINGYTDNHASISKWGMVKANFDSRDSIVVGVGPTYDYNDINTAITKNTGSIIDVDYGTYETEIQNLATDKRIIGKDNDLCVLTGTNKDYDTPPIEIAGGIIKNFTVRMVNNSEASHKGYCLHSDNSNCANNKLIVDNCKFVCVGQHTVGMGIYPNEEVIYKNCEFLFSDIEDEPAHASFFAHNSGASDGTAIVRFHNCIFRGNSYAIKLSSYSSNCTMKFEFIDCTFASDTLTGENMIWTDYVAGDTHDQDHLHVFRGKMPLLPTSHGNNIAMANYSV